MELISFNLIYEFLFFSFVNLKLLKDIQIFCLIEVLFKESFDSWKIENIKFFSVGLNNILP